MSIGEFTGGTYSGVINTVAINDYPETSQELQVSDTGDGTEALSYELERRIIDTLQAAAAATSTATMSLSLTDSGEGAEALGFAIDALASASANGTASIAPEIIFLLADDLVATGACTNLIQAISTVAVSAAIVESLIWAYDHTITDTATMAEAIASNAVSLGTALATANATSAIANTATVVATLSDAGAATGAATSTATITEALTSGGSIVAVVNIDGVQYTAWTVNATTGGVTEYQNFPFNSFAYLSEHDILLGAKAGGIYQITGDTDDGSTISGSIKTGMLGFGTPYLKRVEYMGLGYSTDGTIYLKAVVVNDGRKREHWYKLTPTDSAPRQGEIRLGLGLQSRYWQFELTSSADFEITDIEFYPLALSRRGGA